MISTINLFLLVLVLLIFVASLVPLVPMRKRQGAGRVPVVTLLLLLGNILLFFASVKGLDLTDATARVVGLVPGNPTLVGLLTHIFFHANLTHLFGNMLLLWLFGPHVEEALGRWQYLLLYMGAGITGGLMQMFVTNTFMQHTAQASIIGASGAVFGVLGVFALRFWRTKVRVLIVFPIPAVVAVGLAALINLVSGLQEFGGGSGDGLDESIAYWAHVGGFAFGAGMAGLLRMRDDGRREYQLEDAEKAVKKGELDKGAAFYRAALEDRNDDAEAHLALARVCVQQRQGEAAHRHYADAIRLRLKADQPIATAKLYEEACAQFAVFPLPPDVLQRVAGACETVLMFPLAQRALSELCRDHPDAREAELALLRLGKLHLQKLNQPQSAAAIFQEFLRLYPKSDWTRHVAGLLMDARSRGAAA